GRLGPACYRTTDYDAQVSPRTLGTDGPSFDPADHEQNSQLDVPLSVLLRALMEENCQRSANPGLSPPEFKLHCIVQSYGPKIARLACMEALIGRTSSSCRVQRRAVLGARQPLRGEMIVEPRGRSAQAEELCPAHLGKNGIESLVLFNAAFHPDELMYP